MSSRFIGSFRLLPAAQTATAPWNDPRLIRATGYEALAVQFAGCTFENGLYRLQDAESGPLAEALIADAFPDFASRVCPFAYDWLGRQFALDSGRVEEDEPLVMMMEPGTGKALEIPLGFKAFHEQLAELREPALAATLFTEWAEAHPDQIPLSARYCVGYELPLFLGGKGDLDNLEVIELDVYWSLSGQLRRDAKGLPRGRSIRQISVDESRE